MSQARVLFVDDEAQILNTIIRYFRRDEQIQVDVALSPLESFRMLSGTTYDVVVSDWRMPEMDGGVYLSMVSQKYPDVARALMTGVPDASNIASVVNQYGVKRIFLKPVRMEEMREGIVDLIKELKEPGEKTAPAPGVRGRELLKWVEEKPKSSNISHRSIKTFVQGFLNMAASIDPAMVSHSRRVAAYAAELYEAYVDEPEQFGMSLQKVKEGRTSLLYAALLHDIGKLYVDRRVLEKDAPLRPEQQEILLHRLEVLKRYVDLADKGDIDAADQARNGVARGMIDRVAATLKLGDVESRGWKELASTLGRLSTLTANLREEIDLTLVDTEMAEAIFEPSLGSLTRTERRSVESHTLYSELMVKSVPWPEALSAVPKLCRRHHERLDGSGYPDGIGDGPEFTPELRVLTVADVYDAITDPNRSYRKPLDSAGALKILTEEAERGRLDAKVVAAAQRLWGQA